ncbi:MAG: polysaccharide deacetylase family protein, partial [Terriglobia bacterium]
LFADRQGGGDLYLTFDDFPKPNSSQLLDELAREDVPATFFCIGSRVAQDGVLLRRALKEGHSLQIHSWDHERDRPRLGDCVAALKGIGATPGLYRPPGREQVLKLDGSPLGLPDVDPYDFQRPGSIEIVRRVVGALRPGAVIQLHAGVDQTLAALPAIIDHARKLGYVFKVLGH